MSENKSYATYQSMMNSVSSSLSDVIDICEQLELESRVETLKDVQSRFENEVFSVGIMGEFRRGKSSVINALLGRNIVPVSIVPTSATPNIICWGSTEKAIINFKDGSSKEVPVDQLIDYVTKINAEKEKISDTVQDAVVYYPCQFCQNGVRIIDTPGLNDDEKMTYISEQVIPTLDAIIMVLVPDSPVSNTELGFIVNKVLTSDLGKIIFLLNKADLLSETDIELITDHMKQRIREGIIKKLTYLYDDPAEAIKDAEAKIGEICLYPISARNALQAKLSGNASQLSQSGILEFEDKLSQLLTRDRGLIKLMTPVNQIRASIADAGNAINARYESYNIEYEKFQEIHEKQKLEWKQKRAEKEEYVKNLKNKAASVYQNLVKFIPEMYIDLENDLINYIDNYEISEECLKDLKSGFAEQFSVELQEQIQNHFACCIERLEIRIREEIANDLIDVNNFTKEIASSVVAIQDSLKGDKLSTKKILMLDIATNFMFGAYGGCGGIFEGWKVNGVPGALVGGLSGLAAGFAATFLLATIGLPAIPVWVIGGAISTLTGKGVVKKVFANKSKENQIKKFKQNTKDEISKETQRIKAERPIENWLKENTDLAYKQVSEAVEKEIEGVLIDFEKQMEVISAELSGNKYDYKNKQEKLSKLGDILKKVLERVNPIYDEISTALNIEQ